MVMFDMFLHYFPLSWERARLLTTTAAEINIQEVHFPRNKWRYRTLRTSYKQAFDEPLPSEPVWPSGKALGW